MASLGKHFEVDYSKIRPDLKQVFQGKFYRITILSERLIRFEYNKNGKFLDAPTNFAINRNFPMPNFKVEENSNYLIISTRYFTLQYLKERPFKGPVFSPDSNLRVRLTNTDKLWYPTQAEARNFKSTAFSIDDFKNVQFEKGLYSTDGFVSIDDSESFKIEEKGTLRKRREGIEDTYLFMYRRDFGYCLRDYYTLTGFPPLIPKYALGIWWNRDRIYGEYDIKRLVELFHLYEIPLSVMLLSEFWHIKDIKSLTKSGYEFSERLFPDPKAFIKDLHSKGVRIGINLDPVEGIKMTDSSYKVFSKELQKKELETIPFNAMDQIFMMTFIEEILDKLMSLDVDFFWLDYQEDIKMLESLKYFTFNNYAKSKEKRPMVFARDSLVASHRYPVIYSGKTTVSWNTLDFLPSYNSSASNRGLSWISHDVGGYKEGIEDSELYLRYIQFSTFSPIFRFSAERGPYYKREPWLWDIKTYVIAKDYCNLRHRLIPYLYSENYKYHKTGLPIVQPLYYNNPEIYDEPTYKNEYLFGSEMLIAPITKPKDTTMDRSIERIFLPKGIWYDFKTGKKFSGNKRYVAFYKDDDYPVFVKQGGIIPLSYLSQNKNDLRNPDKLEINIFPGKSNTYKLYEDDGITRKHEEGLYIITDIEYIHEANNFKLNIQPVEGKTGIIPAKRNYVIKFRNIKIPNEVNIYLNGVKVEKNVDQTATGRDFIITLKGIDTTKQLSINCKGKDMEVDTTRIFNEDVNSILSDLKIETKIKEEIANIIFSDRDIKRKRILIKKLKKQGLHRLFINMFLKLLEYGAEI